MIVVDGRVFGGRATGIQRVARGAFDAAREQGLEASVVAPRGVEDPRVDRHLPTASSRVYEQLALPLHARGRTVLSLANTAPILVRHSVVFVHDLGPSKHPEWFAPRMRLYARAVETAARRADVVLTPSQAIADEITSLAPRGTVRVVRPATELAPATPAEVAAVRGKHGLAGPYAVLLGWADPRKDLATALAAHRRARAVVAHDLVLVGSAHPNLAPVDLPADVVHAGAVGDDELRALLTGAHVLLHPSRYEGFGLPPLEAAACGTASLLGDVPAVREATHDLLPVLPLGNVDAWTDALVQAIRHRPAVPQLPRWTWTDTGAALLAALT
ncbi:MAG: glycosyltransferase family 1 protein [Frankiales bacterium]|nr:glycosyltransferase family 1 protein [Frankiales bacterium]